MPSWKEFRAGGGAGKPMGAGENVPCGPDPQSYVEMIRKYADAGFDELYIQQIGPNQDEFFTFFAKEVEPLLA